VAPRLADLERGRLIETRSLPFAAPCGAGSLSAGMRSALLVSGASQFRWASSDGATLCAPRYRCGRDRSSSRTRGRRSAPAAALRTNSPKQTSFHTSLDPSVRRARPFRATRRPRARGPPHACLILRRQWRERNLIPARDETHTAPGPTSRDADLASTNSSRCNALRRASSCCAPPWSPASPRPPSQTSHVSHVFAGDEFNSRARPRQCSSRRAGVIAAQNHESFTQLPMSSRHARRLRTPP